jgi:hypothetical protein
MNGMDKSESLPDHMKKANILEDVVALLHEDPEVEVRKKVRLPTRANSSRKREIDVLVTGSLIDYPVRIAFECKNYGGKIGVAKIDEFNGKLEDVGIPVQHGIYVTAGDYTSDARERAEELGMRLLRLEGLTSDRLAAEVHEAFQSVIFLLAEVTGLNYSDVKADAPVLERDLKILRDAQGRDVGTVYDLIWTKWRDPDDSWGSRVQARSAPRLAMVDKRLSASDKRTCCRERSSHPRNSSGKSRTLFAPRRGDS